VHRTAAATWWQDDEHDLAAGEASAGWLGAGDVRKMGEYDPTPDPLAAPAGRFSADDG